MFSAVLRKVGGYLEEVKIDQIIQRTKYGKKTLKPLQRFFRQLAEVRNAFVHLDGPPQRPPHLRPPLYLPRGGDAVEAGVKLHSV
jgi:hypothetical protein